MIRSRPELPPDSEPVGGDDKEVVETKQRRRKRRRDEERDVSAQPEPDALALDEASVEPAEEPDSAETRLTNPERVRREVVAEAAFQERVALAELAGRLSPEAFADLERALVGRSTDWQLEKGRYLFIYLVGEQTVATGGGSVHVEQKLALNREEPPAEPERVDEQVAEAVILGEPVEQNVRRLEPLRVTLAAGDEVRVRVAPDQPEIVVTAEAVTVEPAAAEIGPAEPLTAPPESPAPDTAGVERLIAEVEREPVETEEPIPTVAPETPSAAKRVVATGPEARAVPKETPPDSPDRPDLTAALAVLDREAVDLHDLPPIRGGAPEPGEAGPPDAGAGEPTESPIEPPEPPPEIPPENPENPIPTEAGDPDPFAVERPSEPRRRSHRRPRHHRSREILRWDPDSAEVVRYPDHRMRQKARKLVRRLAAEYGLKLTPQIEAYLLGIILQPHLIGGRRVYSLGLNIERLVSVLQVLKYNFNLTHRPSA